jgi:hypothetical protein
VPEQWTLPRSECRGFNVRYASGLARPCHSFVIAGPRAGREESSAASRSDRILKTDQEDVMIDEPFDEPFQLTAFSGLPCSRKRGPPRG